MPTASTTIWSLDVVKTHLKARATSLDDKISQLADGVSSRIDEYIRRKIVSQSVTEVLSPLVESPIIRLRNFPVSAVSELKYRTSLDASWITFSASDYELDSEHGTIELVTDSFPAGSRRVSVTYTAGWGVQDNAAIPRDIYTAGLDWMKFIFDRWNNDLAVAQSVSEGQRNLTVPKDIPEDVKQVLERHVKRRI